MDLEIYLFILAVLLLVWLAAARDALARFSRGRVRRIEARDRVLARKAEDWVEARDGYEMVLRSGILLAAGMLAALIFSFLNHFFGDLLPVWRLTLLTALVSALMLLLLQLPARILACYADLHILRPTMPVLKLLRRTLFLPAVTVLSAIDDKSGIRDQQNGEDDRSLTEDEIMSLLEQENGNGGGEDDERRMIRGIFDLDDTAVREIMTPRVDIVGLPISADIEEAKRLIVESGHSRIPVYHETVDEIRGVIYAKDFLKAEGEELCSLAEIAHPPLLIPETKAVADLLKELQKTRNHFAVLIDEYGGTAGIVTLEDIIEEIIGDIQDEYDDDEDIDPEPQALADGAVVFDARTPIDDVNEQLNCQIPDDEDVDTIGGFVCGKLGRIPKSGEELVLSESGLHITVLKADQRRVLSIKIARNEEENDR